MPDENPILTDDVADAMVAHEPYEVGSAVRIVAEAEAAMGTVDPKSQTALAIVHRHERALRELRDAGMPQKKALIYIASVEGTLLHSDNTLFKAIVQLIGPWRGVGASIKGQDHSAVTQANALAFEETMDSATLRRKGGYPKW